jgi:hypothetical protein
MDTFTRDYIDCALWASTDEEGEPLDGLYTVDDLSPETLAQMVADCADFQASFGQYFEGREGNAGHDFWLTRNRHGAGFWDRGQGFYSDGAGKHLTEMSHAYGEYTLYVGDDGLIHGS